MHTYIAISKVYVVACVAALFVAVGHSQWLQDYNPYAFLLPSPPAGATSPVQVRYR